MSTCQTNGSNGCPWRTGRREFLAAAGASMLAWQLPSICCAAPWYGAEASAMRRARLRAMFVRPGKESYHMSWPGASFDPDSAQAEYTRTLTAAAAKLGVELDLHPVPLHDPDSVSRMVEELQQQPCDGMLLTVMHLQSWPQVEYLLRNRGPMPAVVFSPLGTALGQQVANCRVPGTYVAATPDHNWLTCGMRMLRTDYDLKNTRLCVITDAAHGDRRLSPLGTTLHFVPLSRWTDELRQASLTEEMREIAKYYATEAQAIVEPEKEDLLNAAKNYVVARRIMAAEHCQGISLDCGPLVAANQHQGCGPCLAWSRLLDEGCVGGCEADTDAALSLLLAARLLDRPGFMQDPAPDTVHNTLIGSHCTCATRLNGYDQPHVPFSLRSHYESKTGVALRVFWQPGQDVTLFKFQGPATLLMGTGQVVSNVAAVQAGGCRTAVEIKLDHMPDVRDARGHHQVLVTGRFDNLLRAYCELAGIRLLSV